MGVQRFDRLHPVGGRARVVDAARFGLGRDTERRAVAVEPPGRLGAGENAAFDAAQRYQVELRYGLDGRKGRARWMPFIGVESADGSSRALRLGVALTSGLRLDAGLELGLRQGLPGADPEYAVQLRGALRW